MPSVSYPLPEVTLPFQNLRVPSRNLINLRSGELIHPEIANILSEMKWSNMDDIQFYPYLNDTVHQIADLLGLQPTMMTLSAGSDLMISVLIEALGSLTGRIILQSPNYPCWHNYASLRKMEISVINFGESKCHAFCLSQFIEKIEASVPAMVVIVNPHSPTGFFFTEQEILIISDSCKMHGHLLVIDECYMGFSTQSPFKIATYDDHVVVIKSFSKSFGIAGARIALTIASEKITNYLSNWRLDFAISGFSFQILKHMLYCSDRINQVRQDIMFCRERFIRELHVIKPNWKSLPSSTNFVVFQLDDQDKPILIQQYLSQHGFHIGNLSHISGLDNCIRIAIAHWDIMAKLLKIIKALAKDAFQR